MIAFAFIILLFIWIHNASQNRGEEVSILGYKTKFFHISDGASKKMFENMIKDGIPPDSIKVFVIMEDEFLRLEHMAVCNSLSLRNEGYTLSDKIKDTFTQYQFSYHISHLKQMSEPYKLINQNITC
jgi:hypothetical protein|tara:strand:+ start:2374 stop:2754 length:381 start_codon:yes stop_codon:yes gene_type:complete